MIKFKAWDIKNKGWIAGFNMVNYHDYYNKGLYPSVSRYDRTWENKEYILVQFSGLKDQNGQNIYFRSDVVEASIYDQYDGSEHKISGVLFLDHKRCKISMRGHEDFKLQFADELVIIGNIQERPKLMEK